MRALLAAVACAAAVAPAVTPASAAQCVGTRAVEGWTGVCAGGEQWLVCARDAHMHPVLYVYVPGPESGGEPCGPGASKAPAADPMDEVVQRVCFDQRPPLARVCDLV